ncbi:SurA N-terminal domain-containing protein [Leeia sp. TBRC 13508]|uniref:Periplasmic chaperone PpiD n=1 Tax=Leeia speluncae TaxID=2884804 RepID=A0ABS8D4F6_9NEIS|nr:SurA N-terminal domain-containing protein [Leeia speluncae]MCB6183099.1 SurA N-terminal domain-containing protein [Leeia speluncae]
MFDFVQKNQVLIKVLLGGIALTFVGFGVSSYNSVSDTTVATVDGAKIDLQELEKSLNSQNASAEEKNTALQRLIIQKMLDKQAGSLYLTATDSALRNNIAQMQVFQRNGKFDEKTYQELLANNNLTAEAFEDSTRKQLAVSNLLGPIATSTIISKTQLDSIVNLMSEQRDVSVVPFQPSAYLAKASVSDAEIKAYYDKQKSQFNVPERVKVDYVLFSPETLAAGIQVKPEEVNAIYEKTKSKYEERQVRHILVAVPQGAKPADVAAAKAKAEKLLAEVKAKPDSFADVAKRASDDTGSAQQGGDLGLITSDKMVKPFSDAAYALNKGQISGVVKSEFGFHIIQVTDIKVGDPVAAKAAIESDLKLKEASAKLNRDSETFKNLVNEEAKSLQPAATKFAIAIAHSDWLDKSKAVDEVLNKAEVRDAVFQADVISKGYNTEVVELGQGRLLAARVTAHEKARLKPLQEASAQIKEILLKQKALALAKQDANAQLASLKAAKPAQLTWSAVQSINRMDGKGLDDKALKAVFGTPLVAGKSSFVVTDLPDGGVALLKVDKSTSPLALTAEQKAALKQKMTEMLAEGEVVSYQKWLQAEMPVKVYPKLLGAAAQQ